MDRLFNGFAENFEIAGPARGYPPLNVWESEGSLHAEAEVPGMRTDDVEILVVGNELIVKGARKPAGEENVERVFHRRERGDGTFSRVVRLPVEIDAGKVSATLKDGILSIDLPKAEVAKPRRIEVKYAGK
jgi:HSP20 family protein